MEGLFGIVTLPESRWINHIRKAKAPLFMVRWYFDCASESILPVLYLIVLSDVYAVNVGKCSWHIRKN